MDSVYALQINQLTSGFGIPKTKATIGEEWDLLAFIFSIANKVSICAFLNLTLTIDALLWK